MDRERALCQWGEDPIGDDLDRRLSCTSVAELPFLHMKAADMTDVMFYATLPNNN